MAVNSQSKKVSIASLINGSKGLPEASNNGNMLPEGMEAPPPKHTGSKLEQMGQLNAENNLAEFEARNLEYEISNRSRLENLGQQNSERTAGFSDLKKIMAMLKVYRPVVAAATLNPGSDVTSADEATERMVNETLVVTKGICDLMGIDMNNPDIPWVISAIKTMAAEQVGTQWKRATVLGHNDLQTDDYLEAYKTILEMDTPIEVIDDHIRVSTSARIQLSLMKSLMPIIREVNTFESTMAKPGYAPGYKVDADAIISHASDFIMAQTSEFVFRIDLPEGDDSRIIFFQGVLNHTGELYAMSMANEMDSVLEKYDAVEHGKRRDMIKKDMKDHPIGIDLNAVENKFKYSLDSLARKTAQAPVAYAEGLLVVESKKPKRNRRTVSEI